MRLLDLLLLAALAGAATTSDDSAASKRISQQKCDEYLEQVSRTTNFVILTAVSQTVSLKVSDCATTNVHLIVKGEEAKVGEFPHMAALGYRGDEGGGEEWLCGGSLISRRFVLTAAHCISHDRYGSPRVVRLGEHDLSRDDDGASPQDYPVESTYLHPEYRPPRKYHDIALLKLSRDVHLTKKIRPACLREAEPAAGDMLTASGWGRTQYSDAPSPKLLKVTFPVIGQQKCSVLWNSTVKASASSLPRGIDPEVMLCAGDLEGGKDTCLGDSGGPLSVRSASNTCVNYVVGVTSFGRFCGWKNSPGIYTRVSHYLPWIEEIVWPQQDHQDNHSNKPDTSNFYFPFK